MKEEQYEAAQHDEVQYEGAQYEGAQYEECSIMWCSMRERIMGGCSMGEGSEAGATQPRGANTRIGYVALCLCQYFISRRRSRALYTVHAQPYQ